MAVTSICTCIQLAIHVHQIAGEFGQGGEKSKDTALCHDDILGYSIQYS